MNRQRLVTDIFEQMGSMHRQLSGCRSDVHFLKHMPTRAQMSIMIILEQEETQHVKELAVKLRMSSSAVTQLVDGLVKERLLKRHEDRQDRRRMDVSLTENGKKMLIKARKRRLKNLEIFLSPLSVKELEQLKRLQRKLLALSDNT